MQVLNMGCWLGILIAGLPSSLLGSYPSAGGYQKPIQSLARYETHTFPLPSLTPRFKG